jgi:hypothetical protein
MQPGGTCLDQSFTQARDHLAAKIFDSNVIAIEGFESFGQPTR